MKTYKAFVEKLKSDNSNVFAVNKASGRRYRIAYSEYSNSDDIDLIVFVSDKGIIDFSMEDFMAVDFKGLLRGWDFLYEN